VAATLGVILYARGRLMFGRRASLGHGAGESKVTSSTESLLMRDANRATSSLCCSIVISMLR